MASSSSQTEVIAIIPARGGSKGIPRKNLAPLGGKPLIAHSIESALASRLISRVVVSTEDEEIAEVAQQWGAEVPFLRPANLAGDRSSVEEAVRYTLQRLRRQGYHPVATVLLFPTSPFRPHGLIDHLVTMLLSGFSPVKTVTPIQVSSTRFFTAKDPDVGATFPLRPLARFPGRRLLCYPNGVFTGSSITGYRPYLHPIRDPMATIDIDTPEDLALARAMLQRYGQKSHSQPCLH